MQPFVRYHGHKSQTVFQKDNYFVAKYQQQLSRLTDCLIAGCVSGTDLLRQFYVLPHWEKKVANEILYLTQSQYTDTGPTSPSADLITPGAWHGSHWSANF